MPTQDSKTTGGRCDQDVLRRNEERLRLSQRLESVGRLAGGIAHDFNNLLMIIEGYCHVLLQSLSEGELRHNVEEIDAAAKRATSLTRQLLAFSRRQVLEPKLLNLNSLVTNMEKMLRRLIGEDIELLVHPDPDLGQVMADPGQIDQVIINLVVNARDAMAEGGKLTIETASVDLDEMYAREHSPMTPGPYMMLAVSDTGCGMEPETQAQALEPFFTTKEQGKGTGLGLSTVYGIIKQSGGFIWIYSEVGQGATFKIYLPRVDESPEAPPEPAADIICEATETILVVEDEARVRQLISRALRSIGYYVIEAESGQEAIVARERHDGPVHLLLTDVVMPGMSGRQLEQHLRPHNPEMRVLYMSGYTDNSIVHHGVLDEGIAFLEKPFTLDSLSRKVRETLGSP